MTRIHVYKMTNDSGIAPFIAPPTQSHEALLSLAICKPTIRRSACTGDYIVGLSSKHIAQAEGYPSDSIIYFAKVTQKIRGEEYYQRHGQTKVPEYSFRKDRIYTYDEGSRRFCMLPNQTGHTESNMPQDLGQYSDNEERSYRNSWVLLSQSFRYFGKSARKIPAPCPSLLNTAKNMKRAHRVFKDPDREWHELKHLLGTLYQRETTDPQDTSTSKPSHCAPKNRGSGKNNTGFVKRARHRC